ncbi:cyclin-dependent kinase-like Serine/Threonine kinase family protein (macronuclear) [Tetrahymena thermophila SB210]|uniref:Cyclin-dependent kinase-like Serine/Threonine kinase family protein n=1 Tax=Tetrahymena thermophila (strain SB210) TaxID=312017 RepID=I7M074_TETTS|nr:cyclin-dependent kinase-like Serine/Threonine kinase family protein [Tetrahymena thermophila SB210]EAR85614.2 cyclin-dependent kinase-like Serine/Threonine kinase family protein [Tetrahymena thermophila SB210]|eukprot:XP_001033277.2 cyclin-dependent kinase-like Serine/Threonine kinase family protein [Tetrahymena thermophila SB210]
MGCGASNHKGEVAEPQPVGNKKGLEQKENQVQKNKKNKQSEDVVIQDLDAQEDIRTESKFSPSKGNILANQNLDGSANNIKEDENQNNQNIQLKRYKKCELIDKGAYGKVYKGIDTITNQVVAIKYIEITGTFEEVKKEINSLKKEIVLLKKLNHQNIVKYYDFEISDDKSGVDIILEYVPNGSLRMALNKQRCFDETKAAIYTKQVLEGLDYLHKNNIIHRDLKGANLLLDAEGRAKLTDFGTAKQIEFDLRKSQVKEEDIAKMNKSLKGTPNWMAPEVIERTGHTTSADIWSIGCIVIEMITGKPPYPGLSAKEVFTKIASGVLPDFPKGISFECKEFLEGCLQTDPKKRLTTSQLLKTPFILRKKIRRPLSQNSLVSQEELLEQIQSIQQGQNIQQEYSRINKGSQPLIKGNSSQSIKVPQIISNQNASSQPLIVNKPNPYLEYQYKNQQKYQEYQDSQIDQLKERTKSLNRFANEHKSSTQNDKQQNQIRKIDQQTNKNINAEDEILQIAKQVKRQQEYVQANVNPGYDQYIFKPQVESNVIKFSNKDHDVHSNNQNDFNPLRSNSRQNTYSQLKIQPDIHANNQNEFNQQRNNSRQNTYSQQKGQQPQQPFRSSLVDIKDEDDMDTTEMIRRSQKSLTLLKSKYKNLNEASSQGKDNQIASQNEQALSNYHLNHSQKQNHKSSYEDLDIELPQESKEVPISRNVGRQNSQITISKEQPLQQESVTEEVIETNQSEPQEENEYLKHENKVITTKAANVQRMMLNKQLANKQQKQQQNFIPNKYFEHQNQVINTDIAQRERNIRIQEQQEFIQDKIKRQQMWEEELKRELEYQKQNPPPYLKY